MPGSVVTIGNFDGVHIGHAALIARAREIARGRAAKVVAMAFDPHPAVVLRPGTEPARLTTFEDRRQWLIGAGADEVVRLEPTRELLSLSAEEFIAGVVSRHAPVALVEGEDFRFGRGRAGDLATLAQLGKGHGFEIVTVPPVEAVLSDHTVSRASSTLVRWLIEQGRATDAARVLGREYELEGEVVSGDRRGRTIGFPTANIRTECLIPGDGVYAGLGVLPDRSTVPTAISVGTKPTFGEHDRTVEAFLLLGESAETTATSQWRPITGLAEYGWRLRLRFSAWVRDQLKFDSLDALLEQMARDCDRVRHIAASGDPDATEGHKAVACR